MSIGITNKPYKEMIGNFSKSLTRTPVTKTTSNVSGDETLTDGTDVTILGAFYRKEDDFTQDFAGLFQGADAVLKVKPNVTINKEDKITYESEIYRIDKVITRRLGTTVMYKFARCFLRE